MIPDEQLSKLKELCERATPGPWKYDGKSLSTGIKGGIIFQLMLRPDIGISHADAEFIAMARTALPALLAEVEKLRKVVSFVEKYMIPFTESEKELSLQKIKQALDEWKENE